MSLIIYVEDDLGIQFIVGCFLRRNGYGEMVLANSRNEGWERLNQMYSEGKLPDLILSGVEMAGGNC